MTIEILFTLVNFVRYFYVRGNFSDDNTQKMADSPSMVTQLCVVAVFFASLCQVGFTMDLSCVEMKKEYVKMGFRDEKNIPISQINGKYSTSRVFNITLYVI